LFVWLRPGSSSIVLASALRACGDSTFASSPRIAQRFRRLEVFHQAGELFERRFRQLIHLKTDLLGDVSLVDDVE
jgi:hypothetical protein